MVKIESAGLYTISYYEDRPLKVITKRKVESVELNKTKKGVYA